MKFFNLDLHISVIADIKNIFETLGHEVVDWSLSGHAWVLGKQNASPKHINSSNWKELSPEICNNFYTKYKEFLDQFDGFICAYPPAFSLLYKKTNKPIILVCPIRYEHPFTNNKEKWEWLNSYIKLGINQNRIIPVANNKYDAEYFQAWIGEDIEHIPSLCEYTNTKYNKTRDEFLLFSRGIRFDNKNIIHRDDLGHTTWETMYSFSGIIHFPYTCSTMSIFEQYTGGIPLYFPSKEYAKELYHTFFDQGFNGLFYDLSFNRYYGLSKSLVKPLYSDIDYNDIHSEIVLDRFIDLCDFYDEELMPNINYFSTMDELFYKINNNIKKEIDNREYRKTMIYDKWKSVLERIAS